MYMYMYCMYTPTYMYMYVHLYFSDNVKCTFPSVQVDVLHVHVLYVHVNMPNMLTPTNKNLAEQEIMSLIA